MKQHNLSEKFYFKGVTKGNGHIVDGKEVRGNLITDRFNAVIATSSFIATRYDGVIEVDGCFFVDPETVELALGSLESRLREGFKYAYKAFPKIQELSGVNNLERFTEKQIAELMLCMYVLLNHNAVMSSPENRRSEERYAEAIGNTARTLLRDIVNYVERTSI